jgi:hypothetical protein
MSIATHTKSKYRMMMFIACGIDANNETIPLAWALVPTENELWWSWFCDHLTERPSLGLQNLREWCL